MKKCDSNRLLTMLEMLRDFGHHTGDLYRWSLDGIVLAGCTPAVVYRECARSAQAHGWWIEGPFEQAASEASSRPA